MIRAYEKNHIKLRRIVDERGFISNCLRIREKG